MKAKRFAALAAAALLALVMLAGCGGNKNGEGSSTGTTPDSSGEPVTQGTGEAPTDASGDPSGAASADTTGKAGSSSAPVNGTTPKPTAPATTGAKVDLKGYEFVLGTIYDHQYNDMTQLMAGEYTKKIKEIEQKYNCKITVKAYDEATVDSQITAAVHSGSKLPNVFEIKVAAARNLVAAGALADMKAYTGLNLDNGNFMKKVTDGFTWGGKVYGTGLFSYGYIGLFYNKDMIAQYAPGTDIGKLYKDGKWTWDAFRDVALKNTKDLNGDKRTDKWGVAADSNMIGAAFDSSVGATALRTGNQVRMVMCDQGGIDALNWMKKLFKDDKVMKYYTTGWFDAIKLFADGDAAMFPGYVWTMKDKAPEIGFDYGFVPFPKPAAGGNHLAATYDISVFVVPKTNKDLSQTGLIFNEFSAVSKTYESKYTAQLRDTGFDNDSVAAFQYLHKNAVLDFSLGPDYGVNSMKSQDAVIVSSVQPSTVIGQIKGAMQKACDDYYGKFK